MDFVTLLKNKKIKPIGRTYIANNKYYMNFSGSGIYFKTNSNRLLIKVGGEKFFDENNRPYLSLIVNGSRLDYMIDQESLDICLELPNTINEIYLLKRSESSVSYAYIEDILVDSFIELVNQNKIKIEFYGDSLTCGYGVLSNDPTEKFSTKTESFLDSYAYLTAKGLDADYSAISVSGFPAYKSRWNLGFPVESVLDMISFASYREEMTFDTAVCWDNNQFIPDILVINLGSNDDSYFTQGTPWIDEMFKEYSTFSNIKETSKFHNEISKMQEKIHSFIRRAREIYGTNIKIIWAFEMIDINDFIVNAIKETLALYQENIYYLPLANATKLNDFGANYHPGILTHKKSSELLINFIQRLEM